MRHSIKQQFREIGCSIRARETATKLEALKIKASVMTVDEELRLLKDIMISHVIFVNYLKENEHSPEWIIEEALKTRTTCHRICKRTLFGHKFGKTAI